MAKPGKSLLTTWHDDAQQAINQLWDEIEARFGICPSFFKLAQNEPPIARNLFGQAEFAYLDNPMPAHFKERLFTWLSRFCEVRYCVARHCAFLIGRGRVAGDASAPPLSVERALALLKELMPDKEELPGYLRALEGTPAPLGDWPDFDSDLGRRFRVACAVVFLDPVHAAPWLRELLRLLGPRRYEQLMLFLAFVRTAHFWTEVHPELAFDPDLMAMLREHEALVEPLLRDTDEAVRWELGRRLCDELQGLRESQKSVEAQRDSEARFRAIFENAAVGIARLAPDGHWLEVNQRLCEFVGYSREELMTKNFADITHPDDLEQDLGAMRRMLAGEIDTYLREKRYYRKDGSVMWANLTVSMMLKADGSPDYFISIVEDISARKWAEEKLLEREERLLLASWVSGLGIFEWDVQADRAVWENERMYEIFGHTRADGALSRAHLAEKYIHPDDVATFGQALADGMKTGRPFHVGYRIRRKDGALRWLDLAASFELARDGAPIRMIGILADITERKQVEEKLRESQERLQIFIEHAPASLAMFDREMRYLAVSRRWMTDYRLGDRDIRGESHYALFPEVPQRWKAVHSRSLEGEIVRADEDRFVRADGKVQWERWETRPWYAADGAIGGIVIFSEDITERKLAEEALRESELRFRTMISAIPPLSYETDADGANIFTSDRWRAYTGMTAEESAGTGFIRAYHPDEAEDVLTQWGAAVRLGMSFERKCRIRAADGSYRWFLNRARPGRDAEGRIVRWAGSLTDIDDLIRAEERVRENELRFRTMVSAVPNLTFESDADGSNTFASDQWCAYTGMSAEETAGIGFARAIHPDDAEAVTAQWFAAVRSGRPYESRHRMRAADGSYRWFLARALPGRDAEGRIVRWAGSLVDIDDLIRIEDALRESEERLNGIVSSAMDAIITVDEEQRVVLFNEAAERMFGCPAAEALGQPFNRFIPERFRSAHTELVRRFGETGASRAMRSLTALRADGMEFPIEAAISKVEVGGRKLYTLIHRDITERKQAEAEREQLAREQIARAAAEAANRSKDEFLAMVSHELRSPLNAILGYTRMLRSGPADRGAINNVTAVVERSAKAQLQIIEDLLDSARIITGKLRIEPGPVDLVPALEAALDTVRSAAKAKGVTLVANFGPLPEQVLGDSTRLQQVVWNLLSNAVKFTPEGGRVELRMEGAADNVRITVSDTGKGVDPEFLPFVFDRFRQADTSGARRYGGLGLGLSLVKYLVELHGGTITAASEGLWRGATFTVTLPRRHPEFIAPPLPAAPLREARTEAVITLDEAFSLEGVSVLVVDDQEEARVILTQALGEYGAQVTAVSSGAEALALLSDPPGGRRPDALILDIAMPDEDGYAVLKKVRALEAEQGAEADQIPAIALTAYGRSEDRLRALQAGFHMYVAKPVETAELAVIVASLTIRRAWEHGRKE
jgi:PAS domain S-box-containing protein